MGSVVIIEGPNAGEVFVIGEEGALIGRDPVCTIQLTDHRVSRRHLSVRSDADATVIEDLQSTNGTRVNGEPLHGPRPLSDGDLISIGHSVLRFRTRQISVGVPRLERRGSAVIDPLRSTHHGVSQQAPVKREDPDADVRLRDGPVARTFSTY